MTCTLWDGKALAITRINCLAPSSMRCQINLLGRKQRMLWSKRQRTNALAGNRPIILPALIPTKLITLTSSTSHKMCLNSPRLRSNVVSRLRAAQGAHSGGRRLGGLSTYIVVVQYRITSAMFQARTEAMGDVQCSQVYSQSIDQPQYHLMLQRRAPLRT